MSVNFTTPHAGDPQPPSLDTFSTFNVGSTFAVISWETPGINSTTVSNSIF